jgi:hypothetical protein
MTASLVTLFTLFKSVKQCLGDSYRKVYKHTKTKIIWELRTESLCRKKIKIPMLEEATLGLWAIKLVWDMDFKNHFHMN